MSHEATHVATGRGDQHRCRCGCSRGSPTTSRCATSTCRSRVTAGQIIAAGPPRRRRRARCPAPAEFDTATHAPRRGLRVRLAGLPAAGRARRRGGAGRASTAASTPAPTSDAALRPAFGFGERELTARVAGPADRTWPRERPEPAGPSRWRRGRAGRRRRPSWSLAALLVPWEPGAGRDARRRSPAGDVFTAGPDRRGPRTTPRWARVWSWSSLAVSLAVACWLGFTTRGPRAWSPGCPGRGGSQVVLGVAALVADRPAGDAAVRRALLRGTALDDGLSAPSPGRRLAARPGQGRARVAIVAHLAGAAGAGRLRPALARGPGRPSPAGCSAAWSCWSARSSTRCWSSRSSTTSRRCPTGRCAPRSSSSPTEEGVRGRRRAGRRRLAAYDDPQRLRVRLRRHPAGRRLRQPRRGPARGPGAVGGGPRAGARPARRRADRVGARRGRRGVRGRPAGAGRRRRWAARRRLVDGRPGGGAAGAGAGWRWRRCWRARCRTRSAGRSRPAPTSTRWRRPGTRRPSSRCSASWRCGRSRTRRRRRWSQFWFGSHPTSLERIAVARQLAGRDG